MTNPLRHFEALMPAILDSEAARATQDVIRVEGEAQRNGAFNGSRRVMQTHVVLSEAVARFAATIEEKWKAYLRPHLSTLSAADRDAYINAPLMALDACATRMENIARSRHRPELHMPLHLPYIGDVAARERRRLEAELSLYAITRESSPMSNITNVTTHGANSPVNLGSGLLTQSVSSTTVRMSDLAIALGDLLAAIDRSGASPDLRQVVEDAKMEAAKPKPNELRLKGSLAAAKDVVQTIGGLSAAWDVVAGIAAGLGFLL